MVSPRILQKLPTQSNDLIWNNGNNEFDNENEKQQQVAISALMNLSGEKGIQASFTICHDHQFDTDFNLLFNFQMNNTFDVDTHQKACNHFEMQPDIIN